MSLSQTPRKKQKIIYRKSKALYVVLTRSRGKETVTTLTWKEIIIIKKKKGISVINLTQPQTNTRNDNHTYKF